jgi:hypothetical protein
VLNSEAARHSLLTLTEHKYGLRGCRRVVPLETVECPKDVSISEDAKLDVEHRVSACEREEKTSE